MSKCSKYMDQSIEGFAAGAKGESARYDASPVVMFAGGSAAKPYGSTASNGADAAMQLEPTGTSAGNSGVPRPPRPTGRPKKEVSRPFEWRDWAVVAMAFAQALLWVNVFWLPELFVRSVPGLMGWTISGLALPGVGLTLVQLAGLTCTLCAIGRRGRYDRMTIPLLIACVLMCAIPTLFGNHVLRVLNCLVLWVTETHTLFLVADLYPALGLSFSSLCAALRNRVASCVRYVPRFLVELWRAAASWKRTPKTSSGITRSRSQAREVLLGVFMAVPILAMVYPLLTSADVVFASILTDIGDAIARTVLPDLGSSLRRALYALLLTPFFFSLMWGLARPNKSNQAPGQAKARGHRLHAMSAVVVLVSLNLVYALFNAVQFVFLFAGYSTTSYAENARSGFFQLVAVATINVIVSLLVMRFVEPAQAGRAQAVAKEGGNRPPRVVRALLWLLVAMTYTILSSAALRMCLYVESYGLTILRCLTFLGMFFIAVVLAALVTKTLKPSFGFYRAVFVSGLALWLAFNLAGVDAFIANHNVNAILDGSLERVDVGYFWSLSADADPALMRLEASSELDNNDLLTVKERLEASERAKDELPWQMQCLPYWLAIRS